MAEVVDAACDGRVRRWAKPCCDLNQIQPWTARPCANSTANTQGVNLQQENIHFGNTLRSLTKIALRSYLPNRKGSSSNHHFSGAMLNFGGVSWISARIPVNHQDDIRFLVENPNLSPFICHCYWVWGSSKEYRGVLLML